MPQQLIVHLGDVKTGSTSIQTILRNRTFDAGGVRVFYPALREAEDEGAQVLAQLALNHNAVAVALRDGDEARAQRLLSRIAAMVADEGADADVVILSAEWFEFVAPERLRDALAAHLPALAPGARLISYVRPHAERVLSAFQENRKLDAFMAGPAGFHERQLRAGTFRYAPRLRRWRAVFGDRFEARAMIRARLRENCVVRDFLGYALDGAPVTLREEPEANRSLSLRQLAFMTLMHRNFVLRPHQARRLSRAMGPDPEGAPLRLPIALIRRIQADYAQDAAETDREFFGAPVLSEALARAHEKAASEPMSLRARDHYAPDELARMRQWALETLAQAPGGAPRPRKPAQAKARAAAGKPRKGPAAPRKPKGPAGAAQGAAAAPGGRPAQGAPKAGEG
ncbi:hypothetical protein [Oceanicella actignis]|uniref:Uncharacterized protein n=1 Tax=Oceanicella actignis TaxID=1189325 RepID=A0A1M7SPN3_9RHOB|nr:hypothetical protein [Oceanicella actignis]SES66229.1 hypothetical protein SAMN04488119_10173 [Oceanicella actignis]SHN60461.1 hypothetical protein SAMN05216200_10374 [Oceanicella actignis]